MNNYPTLWFQGMDEDEKRNFVHILDSNTILLDKLAQIVYNIVTDAEEVAIADYDSPSWACKQAHKNGVADACRKVLKVIGRDGKTKPYS